MPFDTAAKRKAATGAGLPFIPTPPIPDGSIDEADMHAAVGAYVPGARGAEDITGVFRRLHRPLNCVLRRCHL